MEGLDKVKKPDQKKELRGLASKYIGEAKQQNEMV
jgi:hypothetical protein